MKRGIKQLVLAKLEESIPKLRDGKTIFLRVADGSISFETLRIYINMCWKDLKFRDNTLPYVTTKDVLHEGHRAVEIIPRSNSITFGEVQRAAIPPSASDQAAAQGELARPLVEPGTTLRGEWLAASIANGLDFVALIRQAGGIPQFSPASEPGKALIKRLAPGAIEGQP